MASQQDLINALINRAYQPGSKDGSDLEYGRTMAFHPGSPMGMLNTQMMNPNPVDPRLAQAAAIPVNPGDLTGVMQQVYSPQQLSSPVDWTKNSSPQMGMGDGNRVMNQIPGGWSSPPIPPGMGMPQPGTNIR